MSGMIIRRHEVERRVGLGRSSIYALMARGLFPRPVRIGLRAVGWRVDDIDGWLQNRPLAH